jgi:hypothetical protein
VKSLALLPTFPLRRFHFVQLPKDGVRVVLVHPNFGNRARRSEPHSRVLFRPEQVLERLDGSAHHALSNGLFCSVF